MREFFYNLVVGQAFLTMTQNPEVIKEKTDKFNYILGKIYMAKHYKQRQMTNWGRGG